MSLPDANPPDVGRYDLSPKEAARAARTAGDWGQPAFIRVLSDEQIGAFPATGELGAVPFAIKDNIDLAGHPTTAANPRVTQPATRSAAVVLRLVAAGAVPMGKTNLDQYATGLVGTRSPFGACHCAFSDDHISGGSSSGSAIAVASGIVPFALGTDTDGGGRVPAAFNSLVGVKPTRGLVSTRGVLPACRSLDCVTVLADSVAMAARVFEVMVGFDPDFTLPCSRALSCRPRPVSCSTRPRPVIGVPDLGPRTPGTCCTSRRLGAGHHPRGYPGHSHHSRRPALPRGRRAAVCRTVAGRTRDVLRAPAHRRRLIDPTRAPSCPRQMPSVPSTPSCHVPAR